MNLTDKKIAILGCGRSGVAAAHLALAHGAAEVCIFDSNPQASCADASLPFVPGATKEDAARYEATLIVISPGIDPNTSWVRAFFRPKRAPLIGEVEFGYHFYPGRIIAITGTNGKTTTTALVEHILAQAGKSVKACGNYGFPFCEVPLMDTVPEYAALEVSSFQLETIHDFRPEIAIWLNFAPDHMDRYRKVRDYFYAKLNIFSNMSGTQLAIVREGQELSSLLPFRVGFSSETDSGQLYYSQGCIMEHGHALVELRGTAMEQAHNAENAMAALLACRAVGIDDATIATAIRSFNPPGHRCETVAEIDGILWLNDSKSTNLHSTEAAVRSQTRPIILLAGGKNKKLDYSPITPMLAQKARACIVFGEIAGQLEETFAPVCPTTRVETVPQAVEAAAQLAQRGDVVLFSPGTSSFDQFIGYVQRGQCFRDAVRTTLHL